MKILRARVIEGSLPMPEALRTRNLGMTENNYELICPYNIRPVPKGKKHGKGTPFRKFPFQSASPASIRRTIHAGIISEV